MQYACHQNLRVPRRVILVDCGTKARRIDALGANRWTREILVASSARKWPSPGHSTQRPSRQPISLWLRAQEASAQN
jgi:hypothetical protein